ncbi:MAG: hypothetical protein FVQ80_17820 [Planctomycetes bacterium]|nr:hypothetical protein [Planctomycetota bacterium]
MGQFNSSLTRVVPIFDFLKDLDETGGDWLPSLLTMPQGGVVGENNAEFNPPGELLYTCWGENEKGLSPPISLLKWMVQHPFDLNHPENPGNPNPPNNENRTLLLQGEVDTIADAMQLLDNPNRPNTAWYILEGISNPDVYLETENLIVVIEGKRTEPGPTTDTTWMPIRHQMLRHIDCAWELSDHQHVVGFFIVEGFGGGEAIDVPDIWGQACNNTVTQLTLEQSLPHRSVEEREEIANAFLGATTWQAICMEFGIDWGTLPHQI